MTLLNDWSKTDALRLAWRRVRRNKGMAGGDNQTLDHFARDLDARLRGLSDTLRGRYNPGPVRRLPINKAGGGTRILAIPCVRDRVAQAACTMALNALLDPMMSDASFAYRPGRSVEHAAGLVTAYRLRGYHWAVDGDIETYFDTIPHDGLMVRLGQDVRCRATLAHIERWLKGWSQQGCGVAQGSPLSPLLANLYLNDLDHIIDRKETRLVRYADDFLILTRTRAEAEKAHVRMGQELAALSLRLHPEKTAIRNFREGVGFLGLRFRGQSIQRIAPSV